MKAGLMVWIPFMVIIAGCATTKQVTDLEARVGTLENKLTSVEQKPDIGEAGMSKTEETQVMEAPAVVSRPSAAAMTKKDVQLALKNAGYYTGMVDGKFGRNTRKAIRAFQKANGLAVDGIAGVKTKELLAAYPAQ
ncbi:MAG: peptidoglycan-binding domain-containing protein [Candidatus Omnitrophota bacterium]|jgi:peptidoglycan hydrolase-like protein with peptidoglycan-binding domain